MVFQYFGVTPAIGGKVFGFCFEHPAASVDDIADELAENGLITVDRLKSVDDGQGCRLITGRDRVIIGANSVSTISHPNTRHWEQPRAQAA